MSSVKEGKKKQESLEHELLKIDNELFELEKKYGEFKIRKMTQQIEHQAEESKSEEGVDLEHMPEVENSAMSNKEPEVEAEEEVHEAVTEAVVRARKEIEEDIAELEARVGVLE